MEIHLFFFYMFLHTKILSLHVVFLIRIVFKIIKIAFVDWLECFEFFNKCEKLAWVHTFKKRKKKIQTAKFFLHVKWQIIINFETPNEWVDVSIIYKAIVKEGKILNVSPLFQNIQQVHQHVIVATVFQWHEIERQVIARRHIRKYHRIMAIMRIIITIIIACRHRGGPFRWAMDHSVMATVHRTIRRQLAHHRAPKVMHRQQALTRLMVLCMQWHPKIMEITCEIIIES